MDEIVLKIVSATYGPCEGKRLLTGEWSNEPTAKIPYTRDVTPILRALLQWQEEEEETTKHSDDDDEDDPHLVRLKAISGGTGGMKRTSVTIKALHDGCNSMNVVFGDACPGTSKKLFIHYVIQPNEQLEEKKAVHSWETHHVSFAEYEPVILRRRVTFYQEDTSAKLQEATARVLAKNPTVAKRLLLDPINTIATTTANTTTDGGDPQSMDIDNSINNSNHHNNDADVDVEDEDERTLLVARRMGRSQSITEFARLSVTCSSEDTNDATMLQLPSTPQQQPITTSTTPTTSATSPKRLRSATFETVLPMVLSYLQVPERVQCRLVCRLWRNIVRDWGVAAVIDSNDLTFEHAFTRPFLRGILTHSYSSLHSLRLSDFVELQPEDLHPSLPYLRKLRVLDISRCTNLQDETLQLLARHVSATLEVLYIKGLVKVSDTGMIAICQTCLKLRVLEVSLIPITDASGMAIGQHLVNLRALYMRDNYRLTNQTIDIITAKCTKLNQLTLWGCCKMTRLGLDHNNGHSLSSSTTNNTERPVDHGTVSNGGVATDGAGAIMNGNNNHNLALACAERLVSLNLWGCLKLGDDIAAALGDMKNLRTLIVSECHKLTDQFAIVIAQSLPQLLHLHLRYCKRLTDDGVTAIASGMKMLYSLDLSFCTRVTATSICTLLDLRCDTLSELRLQECRQLLIARGPDEDGEDFVYRGAGQQQQARRPPRHDRDGQSILRSLRTSSSNLCMLDLRCCRGQPNVDVGYLENESFVKGMVRLEFDQKSPGVFVRAARCNTSIQASILKLMGQNDYKGRA